MMQHENLLALLLISALLVGCGSSAKGHITECSMFECKRDPELTRQPFPLPIPVLDKPKEKPESSEQQESSE